MRRQLAAAGGLVVLAASLVLLFGGPGDDVASTRPDGVYAPGGSSSSEHSPVAVVPPDPPRTVTAQVMSWMTEQRGAIASAALISMVAPHKLLVGETEDLTVNVGPNSGVAEVTFTVQVDPNVLQVRGGTEGSRTAGAGARFSTEISSNEDRVQVRAVVSKPISADAGSIALVQLQAIAPGTTLVMISDVAVKSPSGNALPFSLSSSSVPVTAESVPSPRPRDPQLRGVDPAEAPKTDTVDTGD